MAPTTHLTRQSGLHLMTHLAHPSTRLRQRGVTYAERRVVGYSAAQMFSIVNDVEQYPQFVNYCTTVRRHKDKQGRAAEYELDIRFMRFNERYTSRVIWLEPTVVHAHGTADGNLFHHLETTWRFGPSLQHAADARTCTVHFSLQFDFRNQLYAFVSHLFFGSVVKNMVTDFLQRAHTLYGPPAPVDAEFAAPQILSYRN
uniref:Polyketide_cyc domain-containing protein n=1 Tax=Globodera pallida TaxID=36090 RepID=A0A183BRX5_GLOPA